MRWPQFSLVTLAAAVAFCAIACCALVYASSLWAAAILTAAIVFLLFSATTAIYRSGSSRAFFLGATIWGGAYLLLTFASLLRQEQIDTFGRDISKPGLLTTDISLAVYNHVLPRLRTQPIGGSGYMMMGVGVVGDAGMSGNVVYGSEGMGGVLPVPATPASYYPDQESFLRVSHALWLWLFAFVGGAVGRWLHSTRK